MKKQLFLICVVVFSQVTVAASVRVTLRRVLNLVEQGDFVRGSQELYNLSRLKAYKNKRVQIKYTLGVVFVEMKLYHMAALQFVYAIKKGNREYKRKALEKVMSILKYLEDDAVFYYAVSLVKESDFPVVHKDKLYFFQGVFHFNNKRYKSSRTKFLKIGASSSFYNKAQYYAGLSYAEENKVRPAAKIFRNLASTRSGVTDKVRVASLMGLARVLYQGKRFEESVRVYRTVPKDTDYWHDVLLESSWAYLRAARFRSALSNFQTLHSPFYVNHYQPESLILRSYIYLYICRYYEMEKVLDLFNATYIPTLKAVSRSLSSGNRYLSYFNEMMQAKKHSELGGSFAGALPQVVVNRVMKNAGFKKHLSHLEKLEDEQRVMHTFSGKWQRSRVGRNSKYVVKSRLKTVKKLAGKLIKGILIEVRGDLKRLSSSERYLRYDMLKGKREFLKKKIARKYLQLSKIDEKVNRNYYIQNGYDYWPFQGESWLDELGNYHYVGVHNCQ